MDESISYGNGPQQDSIGERDDRSVVPGWRASGLDIGRDIRDIRVFTERLAPAYREYPDDSEGDDERRRDQELESNRLIEIAKRSGLYISPEGCSVYGVLQPGKTKESIVYVNQDADVVVKLKDPFAGTTLKKNLPEDAIYEHIIHNLYFPETRYGFMGITEINGRIRIVLKQKFIHSIHNAKEQDALQALTGFGIRSFTTYTAEDDYVRIRDYCGQNALIDEHGKVMFIDPMIGHKVPAKIMIDAFMSQVFEKKQSNVMSALENHLDNGMQVRELPKTDSENERLIQLSKFYIERDSRLSLGEQSVFRDAISKNLVPEIVALAFQIRHNEVLIFKDRQELENVLERLFGQHVPADDILFSNRRFDLFKQATGRSVNEVLVLHAYSIDELGSNSFNKRSTIRDYLDDILSKAEKMDVFELELAFKEANRRISFERGMGFYPSKKIQEQIILLAGHINRARQELIKWVKRGYRTSNTRFDKLLRREFLPVYKLPDKDVMLTPEGRTYIKGIQKNWRMTPREEAGVEVARAQLMLLYAHKKDGLLVDKKGAGEFYLATVQEKGRSYNLLSGRGQDEGFMKLSELRLNIQDGENRIVPGMSKSLIDASQRITDVLISADNPKSIAPVGKNPLLEAKMERLKDDMKRQDKFLMRNINGNRRFANAKGKKRGKE